MLQRISNGSHQSPPGCAALAERLFEFGEDGLELSHQRPRRIHGQQTSRCQRGAGPVGRDAELEPQAFSGRSRTSHGLGDPMRQFLRDAAASNPDRP